MQKFFRLLIGLFLLAGCQKNGDLIQHNNYGILTIKLEYAVDADNTYKIELQDNLFADEIQYADENKRAVNNKKYIITQDRKHFVIYDQNGQKVMDTLLTLKVNDQITLIQLQSGQAPTILSSTSGGGNETDPEPGKTKVRFTYDDELLPDSIQLKLFSCDADQLYSLWDYAVDPPTHLFTDSTSINAYKNGFSSYIQLDYIKYSLYNPPSYILEIRDLKTDEVIQKPLLVDYWFIPGSTTQMTQCNNDLSPKYKFFNIKLKKWVQSGLSAGDMTVFQDEFMYGIPW